MLNLKYRQSVKRFLAFYIVLLLFSDLKIRIFQKYVNGNLCLFNIVSDIVNVKPLFKFVCISENMSNCSLEHFEWYKMHVAYK